MLGNFKLPVSVNSSCDISFKTTTSVEKKNPSENRLKFEKRLCSDNNSTDYQSFLLPLEQDFTKSSKGYASLLASIPDNVITGIHYKNKLKGSNMLMPEHFSNADNIRDTCDKNIHNNSCSSNHDFDCDVDNLFHEKNSKLFRTSLSIFEDDHNHTGTNLDASDKDNSALKIDEGMFSEKCSKALYNYSVILCPNSSRFNNKSDDDLSAETNIFYNGCNTTNDSNIDAGIISTEGIIEQNNQCLTTNIKQTLVTAIHSDNSESSDAEDDSLKETEAPAFISKDHNESGSKNFLNSLVASERECDPIIRFGSLGYVNACFEDDDIFFEESSFLKSINDNWNDLMKNISEEPHESKRVSFVPLPDLVSVYSYESEDDGYRYSLYVLDKLRFQNRIEYFESIAAPYFTPKYRETIYRRNCLLSSHDHVN